MPFNFPGHRNTPPAPPRPTVAVNAAPRPPAVNESTRPGHTGPAPKPPASPYAPSFTNVSDGETVHQRVFLLHGNVGTPGASMTASVLISHHLDSFPTQRYPLIDGYFKALVHLEPGQNQLGVVFEPPKDSGIKPAWSLLNLTYIPLEQNPPVHLVAVLGKDSDGSFDSPDYKKTKEGNGLETLVKKIRMAGYMMSAFTQEQMHRNGFGHRTFRLNEEWQPDTITNRDTACRTTATVHIVRSDFTVAELRDPDLAQQNKDGKNTGGLFGIAIDALRKHGAPFTGETCHVAVIFADAHWDVQRKLILAHAALGGGYANIRLAIFGSQAVHSWPTCFEDVEPCFMDDTRTDTAVVANDSNQSGTAWEACNIGMGAFMHEVGHMLGCPHQPYGVMLRDYITWNRSFMPTEAFCARTNKQGLRLCKPSDECGWHRLDALRFRFHPGFRRAYEKQVRGAFKPNVYAVPNGAIAQTPTGIYLVEIHVEGQCRAHLEFADHLETQVFLIEKDLRQQLPEKYRNAPTFKLAILGAGGQDINVDDFVALCKPYAAQDPMTGRPLFRSNKMGTTQGESLEVRLDPRAQIEIIHIFTGNAVDGFEIVYQDKSIPPVLFGKKGGSGKDFEFRPGENLVGFYVRCGAWIDAIQIITNTRRSLAYGGSGGGAHELIPPPGCQLTGVFGNIQGWTTGIGIMYS